MQATVNKIATALILPFLSWVAVGGVSPELNSPRAGDRFDIAVLASSPMFSDSLRLCPDLSEVATASTEKVAVWAAAPDDTVAALCIVRGRSTESLALTDGIYCSLTESAPGFYRRYYSVYPYGVIKENSRTDTLIASGRADALSFYKTKGTYRITTAGGLRIVTFDGDTVDNVECVVCEVDDSMAFDGDSTVYIHRGMTQSWYAPGYRYPLLRQHREVLLTECGDTIDSNIKWEAVALSQQESKISNDPVNEEIRRAAKERAEQRYYREKDYSHGEPSGIARLHNSVSVDYGSATVMISRAAGDSRYLDMLLCDISGRVYQSYVFGDDEQSVSLSLGALPPSTYLIYIRTTDEPIICKFNL